VSNLILDERDQTFVLFEMLDMDKLLGLEKYSGFSTDMLKVILSKAQKFSVEEIFPTLAEGDKEGCKLEKGNVRVPKCFHRPYSSLAKPDGTSWRFPKIMEVRDFL